MACGTQYVVRGTLCNIPPHEEWMADWTGLGWLVVVVMAVAVDNIAVVVLFSGFFDALIRSGMKPENRNKYYMHTPSIDTHRR